MTPGQIQTIGLLYVLEDWTITQIAKHLHMDEKTVRAALYLQEISTARPRRWFKVFSKAKRVGQVAQRKALVTERRHDGPTITRACLGPGCERQFATKPRRYGGDSFCPYCRKSRTIESREQPGALSPDWYDARRIKRHYRRHGREW